MREMLGRESQIGNLIFPQGVPIFGDDPTDVDRLAVRFFDRMQRGQSNRLMYRHFSAFTPASMVEAIGNDAVAETARLES